MHSCASISLENLFDTAGHQGLLQREGRGQWVLGCKKGENEFKTFLSSTVNDLRTLYVGESLGHEMGLRHNYIVKM